MTRVRLLTPSLALVVTLCAHTAHAQAPDWGGRWLISATGGMQPNRKGFSEEATFERNVETATLGTKYAGFRGNLFEGGLDVRLWRNLGLGVQLGSMTDRSGAVFDLTVPHPFFFGRNRSVVGEATGLKREQLGLHVRLSYLVPVSRRFSVLVSAGPSVFQVRQGIVAGVQYADVYPFDVITLVGPTIETRRDTSLGFNVASEVLWRVGRHVGFGGMLRFARATVEFHPSSEDSRERTISSIAGGFQTGGGLRFIF
ncbi:MAG: hypothetical protein HYX76_05010 [Acidobacteria bacterium]|nr:hypothetical protein [Acidobacteriota bacterium]